MNRKRVNRRRDPLRSVRRVWRLGPPAVWNLVALVLRVVTERNRGLSERICREVCSWPGVTRHRRRLGGIELRVGKRELGHIHADHLVDVPFPVAVRRQLVAEGRALPHHILPESGWVSYELHGSDDVAGAVALFRLAYDRAEAAAARRAGRVCEVGTEFAIRSSGD